MGNSGTGWGSSREVYNSRGLAEAEQGRVFHFPRVVFRYRLEGQKEGLQLLPVRGFVAGEGSPLSHPHGRFNPRYLQGTPGSCPTAVAIGGNQGSGSRRAHGPAQVIFQNKLPPFQVVLGALREGGEGVILFSP
eukprot:scaffold4819_cov126-Amphora_coffeaeformis.AAC.1